MEQIDSVKINPSLVMMREYLLIHMTYKSIFIIFSHFVKVSKSVVVKVGATLQQLQKVDAKEQTITTNIW